MSLKLNNLYEEIIALKDLNPSDQVNSLFQELVSCVLDTSIKNTLTENQMKKLREKASKAEYLLEKYWAKRILNSPNPKEILMSFPYFHNYFRLTTLEWNALKGCELHDHHKKAVFIGGGPLPLTAIILAKSYGIEVVSLEKSKEAADTSKRLIARLNLGDKIKIVNCSGEEFTKYKEFPVILLASLAGDSPKEKEKIIRQIRDNSTKDTHILIRSSYGKRKILYSPLKNSMCLDLEKIAEIRPLNDLINSTVIFKSNKEVISKC